MLVKNEVKSTILDKKFGPPIVRVDHVTKVFYKTTEKTFGP